MECELACPTKWIVEKWEMEQVLGVSYLIAVYILINASNIWFLCW